MMLEDVLPTQSEIRNRMGSSMADIFFDYCHPDSKQLLGVIPPLQGRHKDLRLSGSDQSIPKVTRESPLPNDCVKACTHQDILAVGQKAMEKNERDLYAEMLENYENDSSGNRNMFEAEKRRALQLKEGEIRLSYENCIANLNKEFEQRLQTAIAEEMKKCNKSIQKAVFKERVDVTRVMLQKMRTYIGYIIESVVVKFEDDIRAQKEDMVTHFNEYMRRELGKIDDEMKEIERKNNEALRIQRHELEMQNFADVTYVMCTERMRSCAEKHRMQLCFEKSIQALKDSFLESKTISNSEKKEIVAEDTVQMLLKNELLKIVQEFQKFINFAFNAVPGQAEYLLPPNLQKPLPQRLSESPTTNQKSEY